MKEKIKYYSLKEILKRDAQYNMIFSPRSNGKTFSVLEYGLKEYAERGGQMAIIRRWQEDIRGKRASQVFDSLSNADDGNHISKITKGEWTDIFYNAGKWYLAKYENGVRIHSDEPFAFAFALSNMEHDKSISYSGVTTIMFDEFLTRTNYLADEFVIFMNVLSTIIRQRNNVKIFMLGNTLNKYSPYFVEMGLTHVKDMKQGEIDVYQYGDGNLRVAVEFAEQVKGGKPSDIYFAFDNPKLSMITGKGNNVWELDIYPHKPCKFKPIDIKFTFFIIFDNETLQCEVVQVNQNRFIFIHRKTTEIRKPDSDLVYTCDYDTRPNWRRKITQPLYPIEKKICELIKNDKVFYQDNEVGEIFRNYVIWTKQV